jgi:hypothetical protein
MIVHEIGYRSFAMFFCIPVPIPCLCHDRRFLYVLKNSKGDIYPALVNDIVEGMCLLCNRTSCKKEIDDVLQKYGYRKVSENKGRELDYHVKFPMVVNPHFGNNMRCRFQSNITREIVYSRESNIGLSAL